jgi:hypothetical protein
MKGEKGEREILKSSSCPPLRKGDGKCYLYPMHYEERRGKCFVEGRGGV